VDPPPVAGIKHHTHLQILGVTLASDFSVTAHVKELTAKSVQSLYALRVLLVHGLNDAALQEVYRSVVVARLLYAASAWHGFCKATDRQRINSLFTRAKHCGYCVPDLPSFEELCKTADEQLFDEINSNSNHVLHTATICNISKL